METSTPEAKRARVDDASPVHSGLGAPLAPDAGGCTCSGCFRSSAQLMWNKYAIHNRGGATESKVPVGEWCKDCAIGSAAGQYNMTVAQIKEKAASDFEFREQLPKSGAEATRKQVPLTQSYLPETVTEEHRDQVYLKEYGKFLTPAQFLAEHGVAYADLGFRLTKLPGKFGSVSGILVQDTQRPAKAPLGTSARCTYGVMGPR